MSKKIFKWFLGVLGVLLILYLIVFIYVTVNKESIIRQVNSEISKRLNGKVNIRSIEISFLDHFPRIGVKLHDILITDTAYSVHHRPFLQAKSLYAQLSILRLLKKQPPLNGIRIEKGSIYLFTDLNGYTNKYLFRRGPVKSTDQPSKNELHTVVLEDILIIIEDKPKMKFHKFQVNKLDAEISELNDSLFLFSIKTNILVHGLAFNQSRGSFLKETVFKADFDLQYNKQQKQLMADSISIFLSGHPFNLSASFDIEKDSPQFMLRIHTNNILYKNAQSLLPEKIAKSVDIVEIDQPIEAHAMVNGPLNGGEPLVLVSCFVKKANMKTPFFDFEHATFSAHFNNEVIPGEPRNDPNSEILLNNFTAEWNGLPIRSGTIRIRDLEKPLLTCDLNSQFPLSLLNNVIGVNTIQLREGTGDIKLNYAGPLERNNSTNSLVNGTILINKGNVLYVPRNIEMKNVNALLEFKNSDVSIHDLQCEVLNNKLVMQANARSLLTLINTEPTKVQLDWNIFCPNLNLNAFTLLLKSRKTKNVAVKSRVSPFASKMDQLLERSRINVTLKAAKLSFKQFEAGNTIADISLTEDSYLINNAAMDHAGGHMVMNGSITRRRANYLETRLDASFDNVDAKRVFYAFNNFGQDGIKAENLEGKLSAKVNASLFLDEDGKIYPSSIVSDVDFSLKEGALNNYEPVKKLQRFVFKNRDFDSIRFAELKDRLNIRNSEIKINRMEIQSNVMSLFVEGIYSTKGNTDISIQVPLSNIKKKDADYNPENIGLDKKTGSSIYIRGRPGPDGSIKFKLDPFRKYEKEKEK